ncbi:unnamed protein product, partial [Mesorhabditis spiculigera]
MAWPICSLFTQIQTQCSWSIVGDSVEIAYKPIPETPKIYFGVSVRVLEWIEADYVYRLLPLSDGDDRCNGPSVWFQPKRILTMIPPFSMDYYKTNLPQTTLRLYNFGEINGATNVDVYHGGDPGRSQINFFGNNGVSANTEGNASVDKARIDSFSSATTVVNRNSMGLLGIQPAYAQVEIGDNYIVLPNFLGYLNSWKYPWIFEEDQDLFPVTTFSIGYNGHLVKLISLASLQGGTLVIRSLDEKGNNITNTDPVDPERQGHSGFRLRSEPSSSSLSETVIDVNSHYPNYMFNVVSILYSWTRFVAAFGELAAEADATITICSLDDGTTRSQQAEGFVDCFSRADLTTKILNCCTRTYSVSNGTSIPFDMFNFTYFPPEPSVIFSVELAKDDSALTLNFPYNPQTDEDLSIKTPDSNKTVFVAISLADYLIYRADEIEQHVAVLKSMLWPHSAIDCEYKLYTGMVTGEQHSSRPLSKFRNSEDFYPTWLFTGTFTLEIPAGCMPTITMSRQEVASVTVVTSTECTGSRLLISPSYNMPDFVTLSPVARNVTWLCDTVDVHVEIYDVLYTMVHVDLVFTDGTAERRSFNSSEPTGSVNATEVKIVTVLYAPFDIPATSRYGYYLRVNFTDRTATTLEPLVTAKVSEKTDSSLTKYSLKPLSVLFMTTTLLCLFV